MCGNIHLDVMLLLVLNSQQRIQWKFPEVQLETLFLNALWIINDEQCKIRRNCQINYVLVYFNSKK